MALCVLIQWMNADQCWWWRSKEKKKVYCSFFFFFFSSPSKYPRCLPVQEFLHYMSKRGARRSGKSLNASHFTGGGYVTGGRKYHSSQHLFTSSHTHPPYSRTSLDRQRKSTCFLYVRHMLFWRDLGRRRDLFSPIQGHSQGMQIEKTQLKVS